MLREERILIFSGAEAGRSEPPLLSAVRITAFNWVRPGAENRHLGLDKAKGGLKAAILAALKRSADPSPDRAKFRLEPFSPDPFPGNAK